MSKYFKCFLEYQAVRTDQVENELIRRVTELQSAAFEPLVQFLYPVLNGLFSLLVRQTPFRDTAKVQQSGFAALAHIAKRIQTHPDLPQDKHEHNIILSSYLQHVLAPTESGLSGGKRATVSGHDGKEFQENNTKRPVSMNVPTDNTSVLLCDYLFVSCLFCFRFVSAGG